MESKNELCPVCGYNIYKDLGVYPWDNDIPSDEICPSCGIQFGYDDGGDELKRNELHKGWRGKWRLDGMNWFSKRDRPQDWDPSQQLDNLISRK